MKIDLQRENESFNMATSPDMNYEKQIVTAIGINKGNK